MLELQLPPVLASLPQARAETSNAVWNLKEGALYGFFLAGVSRIFSFAVFLVSKVHLQAYAGNAALADAALRFFSLRARPNQTSR